MQIDWWTLALQAVNFLVLVWLLWRFLYKPVTEVVAKRRALAEEAFAEADKKKAEADDAKHAFEEKQTALAQEHQDLLNKTHQELAAERAKVLEAARQEADKIIQSARDAMAEERKAAMAEIQVDAAGLAVQLTSKLLRHAGSDLPSGVFLDQLERQLNDLPASARDRLQKDLEAKEARLAVVTAATLPADDQRRWRERLSACLEVTDKIDFTTEADLLGGAELRFPHAVLKLTWADQLQKASEHIKGHDPAA